jgi:uncharacterized protein (DUF2236 family)
MVPFVDRDSIVRRIWGERAVVLLIFAGAAAEFALNRAVDWLFVTGTLPRDPLGRLIATAGTAQEIIFGETAAAERALRRIAAVHGVVERQRGEQIPDWAQRDVLYMLIGYSERAYELLYRPLTPAEQADLYGVFHRVGRLLGLVRLPPSYEAWRNDRTQHLARDLSYGSHSAALFAAYRRQLGRWRYRLLWDIQGLLVPPKVRNLLDLRSRRWLRAALMMLPWLRGRPLTTLSLLAVPRRYRRDLQQLGAPASGKAPAPVAA